MPVCLRFSFPFRLRHYYITYRIPLQDLIFALDTRTRWWYNRRRHAAKNQFDTVSATGAAGAALVSEYSLPEVSECSHQMQLIMIRIQPWRKNRANYWVFLGDRMGVVRKQHDCKDL